MNGTELPQLIPASSQTADSAAAMFLLSKLAAVDWHVQKERLSS
jgi:hypothetical protein